MLCKLNTGKTPGQRPTFLETVHKTTDGGRHRPRNPSKVQYQDSFVDTKLDIHNNKRILSFLHEERKTISSTA